MCVDVVIVGGGPIGCWTALQIKKRNPEARIVVYERHPVYQRDHILSIKKESFLQWSKSSNDNACFLHDIYEAQATCDTALNPQINGTPKPTIDFGKIADNRLSCWRHLPKVLDIRTIDFERILKAECERLGVDFVYAKIETPDEVMDRHPECAYFIAADGANSKMRNAIFGPDCLYKRDIFPSLDFNYASHGQAIYLPINTYDKLGHVFAENVGVMQDQKSRINIRMIVSKSEYDAVPNATFKNPLIVTPDAPFWGKLEPSRVYGRTLKEDFYDFLALRTEHARENMTDDPVAMTKIYLSLYRAKKFARVVEHDEQRRTWFLVGDAAMGMPFFRSVNSGLILGAQLAYLLTTKFVGEDHKAAIYNHYTQPSRVLRESFRIGATEARIMTYKNFLRPFYYHTAQTFAAPLVRVPLDYALKKLGPGVFFPAK